MDCTAPQYHIRRERVNLDTFPTEITLVILEYLCGDVHTPSVSTPTRDLGWSAVEDDTWDGVHYYTGRVLPADEHARRRNLRALCLTNQRLRTLAQPFLFRAAVVNSRTIPYLARTLAAPATQHLAESIQVVCLLAEPSREDQGRTKRVSTWRQDPAILALAEGHSLVPPPKGTLGRRSKMREFEVKLVTVCTSLVLKKARFLGQLSVLPIAGSELKIGLPGSDEIEHEDMTLFFRPPPRHGAGGDSVADTNSSRLTDLLEDVPWSLPPKLERFDRHLPLFLADRVTESVTCTRGSSWKHTWFRDQIGTTGYRPQSPSLLAGVSSLTLPQCLLGIDTFSDLLLELPNLGHLTVQFAHGWDGVYYHPATVLNQLVAIGVSSQLETLKIEVDRAGAPTHQYGLPDPDDEADEVPVRSMSTGWERLTHLDVQADVIWRVSSTRDEGPLDLAELKGPRRLVKFLPRKLQELVLRDVHVVPVAELETLAGQCGAKGRFPGLSRVVLEAPVQVAGQEIEAGEICECGWERKVDGQQDVLERVLDGFRTRGVQASISPGLFWDRYNDEENPVSWESDVEDQDEDEED
ncbi:hypothetical protein QBC39DRAFT_104893 [Podospora conica]|nr:hypothetical protein QBC39DRAFT_104893 [Schizothecium conicum]